jgi:uncharacterized membrane protein YbhN (UPF0104 family)
VSGAPSRRRLTAAGGVGIAISIVSLTAVVWWALQQPAPELPSTPSAIASMLEAVGVYALATALRAERWGSLLRHEQAIASRADTYALTLVGFMGNNTLPARGGDWLRVYLMAPRARTGYRTVIGTLVAERLLDVVVLLGLFALLAYGVLRGIGTPEGDTLGAGLVALIVLTLTAGLALFVFRDRAWARKTIEFVRPMATATARLRGRHGAEMLALTALIWALEAFVYFLVADGVGIDMSPVEALYVVALASVFALIPSGPGYAGTLDAAVTFGVRAIGASGSAAVSYLIALRVVLFLPITLAGLVVLLCRYGWQGLSVSPEADRP